MEELEWFDQVVKCEKCVLKKLTFACIFRGVFSPKFFELQKGHDTQTS